MQETRPIASNLMGLLQKFSSGSICSVHEQGCTVANVEGGGQGNILGESLLNVFYGRTAACKKLDELLLGVEKSRSRRSGFW